MTDTTPCEVFRRRIDEMSLSDLLQIGETTDGHLRACAACRGYWDQAVTLAERLNRWEVPEPRRPLSALVMARIADQARDRSAEGANVWPRLIRLMRRPCPVPFAAVLLFGLILALSTGWNLHLLSRDRQRQATYARTQEMDPDRSVQAEAGPNGVEAVLQPPGPGLRPAGLPTPDPERTFRHLTTGTTIIILGVPPFPVEWQDWTPAIPRENPQEL